GKESRLAALCALVYDQCLTFDVEVEFVWKMRKRSWGFWLYLFVSALAVAHRCFTLLTMDNIIVILTTLSVQAILQMRVYALYNQNRTLRNILAVCCAIEVSLMAVFHGITMARISTWYSPKTVSCSETPIIPTPPGCYYSGIVLFPSLFWVPALVFEPMLCGLVVWKAWGERCLYTLKRRRGYGSQLERQRTELWLDSRPESFRLLAKDRWVFFFQNGSYRIFIELMLNAVIWAHFNQYVNIVYPWATAIASILGSRLFLHMREIILKRGTDELPSSGYGPNPLRQREDE
ncbi:hypothetical protein OF83DRAFT_1068844, partial [Amylostereum chailletii]